MHLLSNSGIQAVPFQPSQGSAGLETVTLRKTAPSPETKYPILFVQRGLLHTEASVIEL